MVKAHLKTACVTALSAAVLLSGCSKFDSNATVVTIKNGDATDTISLGYANFAAKYQQSMYDQYLLSYYGEGMWSQDMSGQGKTLQDETKEGVLEEIESQYLAKAHAADYDIKLTDDQTKAIEKAAKKFIKDNPEDTIKEMGATEEYVKQFLEYRTYYNLVSEAAKTAAEPDITEDDCWMRTFTYVVFDTTGKKDEEGNVEEYTEEEIANLKKQAEELAQTTDFDGDVEKLGVTTQNYSYLKGETEDSSMDMSIITAAEALKEGAVSSAIEIDGVGYYVLRLDKDHDEDSSENKKESLKTEAFNTLMDSWKEAITWTVNDEEWAKVEFTNHFKAVEKEEEATEETTEETTEESTEEASEEESTEENTEEQNDEAASDDETVSDSDGN